jgi:lipoprotein NlpI
MGQVAYALCYLYEPQEALQRATRSMAISPSYGVSHLSAGIAHVLLDKPEAALANFSNFRQFEPNSPYEHYAHAWDVSAHLQCGNWTAALDANARSLELNADASHTLCYRAMILQHFGESEKARDSMLEARRRDPSTPQAMWELRLRRWTADAPIRELLLNLFRPLWAMTEGTT